MQHRTRQATFSFFLLASCALWTFPPKSCRATALLHRLAPSQCSTSPFSVRRLRVFWCFRNRTLQTAWLKQQRFRVLEAGVQGSVEALWPWGQPVVCAPMGSCPVDHIGLRFISSFLFTTSLKYSHTQWHSEGLESQEAGIQIRKEGLSVTYDTPHTIVPWEKCPS